MSDPIPIVGSIAIDASELSESFIRGSGPGGQNVNKVSSAVQLRFDLRGSPSLGEDHKRRAATLAGSKLTKDGVIVITAMRFRAQEQNREDARARLVALLVKSAEPPKRRRPTKPTLGSQQRRLEHKTQRGVTKRLRGEKPSDD